jgi:multicomponent K+:H+ antiporter subunit D
MPARAGVIGWAWTAILVGSLLTIVGFARAGSTLFWKSTADPPARTRSGRGRWSSRRRPPRPAGGAVMLTLAVLALLAVFAGTGVGLSRRHLGAAHRPRRLCRGRRGAPAEED